ncbi:hypothetical protein [Thermococcus thermotolerans]|uniref:hypothetical protein n=1 Tax=Thermococcus thermotolerans TaxID=2969672 RepID=UPI0021573A37|nr:hypothetical protein [Thermococcus thermotolerans]
MPAYYLAFIFAFHMMVRYYLVGAIIFVIITVGVLYLTGSLKSDPCKVRGISKHDYVLWSILATIYIPLPAYIILSETGLSISAVIYLTITILYFGYSLSLLREIRKNTEPKTV